MADKRKNRDFEGNGKRKSQMVKSEKNWVSGKSGKSCEKGAGRQSGKPEGTWAPGKSGKSCKKGTGRQSGKPEGTWAPGKSGKSCEKGTRRQFGKPEGTWVLGKSEKGAGRQSTKLGTGTVRKNSLCPVSHRCGGCQYLDIPYEEQLKKSRLRCRRCWAVSARYTL